jgi:cytosine/adenosine deaminase-related metal-dependent hydrolase
MTAASFHVARAEWLGRQDRIPTALQSAQEARASIDVGPVLAFPGLINSHDHLEFNCYEPLGNPPYTDVKHWGADIHRNHKDVVAAVEAIPRTIRLKIGVLKNLLSGVTSVSHHGARLPPDLDPPIRIISDFDVVHSPEQEPKGRLEFLKPWRKKPLVLHMAEATTAEGRERALAFMRWNPFGRRVIGVHGVALKEQDFSRLDALVWCPASNVFLLRRTADVAVAKRTTTILFGSDSTLSAPGTIWDHLRMARSLGGLSDTDLFRSLTDDAERAWRMDGGDFVLTKRRESDPWSAFFATTPADVVLVVSKGEVALAGEEIVEACPEMCAGLRPLHLGAWRKWIRMDIEGLQSGFDASANGLDFVRTMRRLAGTA